MLNHVDAERREVAGGNIFRVPLNAQGARGRVPDDLGVLVIVREVSAAVVVPGVVPGVLPSATVGRRQHTTAGMRAHHLVVRRSRPDGLTGGHHEYVMRPTMIVGVLPQRAAVQTVEKLRTTTDAEHQLGAALVFVPELHLLNIPAAGHLGDTPGDRLLAVDRRTDVSTAIEDDDVGKLDADLLPALAGQQIGHAYVGPFTFEEAVELDRVSYPNR